MRLGIRNNAWSDDMGILPGRYWVVCDGLKGEGRWFMVCEWIGEASGCDSGHDACGLRISNMNDSL